MKASGASSGSGAEVSSAVGRGYTAARNGRGGAALSLAESAGRKRVLVLLPE